MRVTIQQLPAASIEAARIAMAEALANDGDGVPEAIVAALTKWPGIIGRLSWDGSVRRIILPLAETDNG